MYLAPNNITASTLVGSGSATHTCVYQDTGPIVVCCLHEYFISLYLRHFSWQTCHKLRIPTTFLSPAIKTRTAAGVRPHVLPRPAAFKQYSSANAPRNSSCRARLARAPHSATPVDAGAPWCAIQRPVRARGTIQQAAHIFYCVSRACRSRI